MTNSIRLLVLIVSLLFLATSAEAAKKARSCSSTERAEANQQLLSIASSPTRKATLSGLHLPFGAHQPQGSTKNEQLLFQEGYILKHDTDLRTAPWVSYKLTKGTCQGLQVNGVLTVLGKTLASSMQRIFTGFKHRPNVEAALGDYVRHWLR